MSKKKIKRKIFTALLFLVLLAGLLALLFSGDNKQVVLDVFGGAPIEKILDEVQSLGWQGIVVFGALSMMQVVLTFLPAEPVQVLAGISYGLWIGVAICMVGVVLGNTLIYILYRVYGDRLSEYFQKQIEVDFEVLRVSKRVTLLIFILYFLPAIPYGLICFFTASLKMRYPKYIAITTLGSLPSVLIGVALGHIATNSWIVSVVILAVLLVIVVLLYVFRRKVFEALNRFAKKQFSYTSQTKVREPSAAFNAVIFAGLKLWLKRRIKCKIKRGTDKLERPAVVLCNHGSFVDFMYFSMLLSKEKPHVVATRQYFYEKKLGKLLKKLGCIPKSMFTVDVENIRNCLTVIKNNGVLVICPEARLSTAGDFEDIQPGTMSFLRKIGGDASIYTIKFGGDYLAMPKWARKGSKRLIRRGSVVEAELKLLFDKGESLQVSPEEFETRVMNSIDYNDFQWLAEHPEIHYPQGNLAEGLENILYLCPKCGKEFTLTTHGNEISCDNCGYRDTMDDRYVFTNPDRVFENHQQWYHWQLEQLQKQIDLDPCFEMRDQVTLFRESKGGGATQLRQAGSGECVFNRQGLTYIGTESGEQITKFFPINTIYRLLFGAGEDFEIYEGDKFWYFVPEDKRSCVKWYMASMLLCR